MIKKISSQIRMLIYYITFNLKSEYACISNSDNNGKIKFRIQNMHS